ncbi:carbohydrate sulfotransferase 11-like [Branchiostoma floridae x Branchiostoma belcheri]
MVEMISFRPTPKFLFFSILILSIGAAYMYYINYNGVDLSSAFKVSGALSLENDDWGNLAEAEEEQSRRLATFKAYCEKNVSTGDPRKVSVQSHLLFYDNIKTMYCYIPKVACKTMKLLFYNLEHNTTERLISVGTADFKGRKDNYIAPNEHKGGWIHSRGHKKMKHYSEEELSLRLATYRKIIIVRDPLERLASAWLNKFVNMAAHGTLSWVKGLNRRLTNYRRSILPDQSSIVKEEATFNATKPVPFRDFLFGVSQKVIVDNEHWTSFNRLCQPCQIDYDFIAHTDTVATDVRLFLKKYNITANEEILPAQRPRHANSDNVFSDIYAQVTIEEILPLREIFLEDFGMFGYSFDHDLAKILEGKSKE